jgi:hypothetical protein
MAAESTHAQEVMGSPAEKLAGVSLSEDERKMLGAMFALALAVVGEREGGGGRGPEVLTSLGLVRGAEGRPVPLSHAVWCPDQEGSCPSG